MVARLHINRNIRSGLRRSRRTGVLGKLAIRADVRPSVRKTAGGPRAAVEGAPAASAIDRAVPVLDGFMWQVFEALRAAAHSGERWFMRIGEPGFAVQPADAALSPVAAQIGEGRNLSVLPQDAIRWMVRNPNSRHLVPAALAIVAGRASGIMPPKQAGADSEAPDPADAPAAHVSTSRPDTSACEVAASTRTGSYRTGLPGRPTSWYLIEAECRRRYAGGERHPGRLAESRAGWARVLIDWVASTHEGASVPRAKTLTNKLGELLRELTRGCPK